MLNDCIIVQRSFVLSTVYDMSLITLQLGQCGNQVGYELFNTLLQDCRSVLDKPQNFSWNLDSYSEACLERFFTIAENQKQIPKAKAVLVDMESKVILKVCQSASKSGLWSYNDKNCIYKKCGSGNNWAAGFHANGPLMVEPVLEQVRKEVELCDRFDGFLALLSLAGGTGSGVGTYITQCLRDYYPNCMLLGQVVWPYQNGEVIVQNYNSLLTLSNLYRNADAIIAMDNDTLQKICIQRLAINRVAFSDLNRVMGHKLASILQPASKSVDNSSHFIRSQLGLLLVFKIMKM